MNVAVITGSNGLIGSECVSFFADKMDLIIGIDNDMRAYFFGEAASTQKNRFRLIGQYDNYKHYNEDIRNYSNLEEHIFKKYAGDIKLIIHAAAQPSHDWAAREPLTDFAINVFGTVNMLELTRIYCPKAAFIFTSSNKVYGDTPNRLPLLELERRYEIADGHDFYQGIDERMSVDDSKHSLFGASKLAADVFVQEYGKYFGMNTAAFRGGCLTGGHHSGAQLHGFLNYLIKCAKNKERYTIFGYKGKQVRDNIHAHDVATMFWHYYNNPRPGEVYNIGGSRHSHCSVLEAIELAEIVTGNKMDIVYDDKNRIGDHIWYVSNVSKFRSHYPEWNYEYTLAQIIEEINHTTC